MFYAPLKVVLAVLFANFANGQLVTTTNNLGLTVVEDVTLGQLGVLTTETLETVTAVLTTTPLTTTTTNPTTSTTLSTTSTTPTTAAATTSPPQVVGAPPDTTGPAPPTVYVFTTTNGAGATVVETATFTPSFAPTTTPTPVSSGTILEYSQWLSLVGTSTVAASSGATLWRPDSGFLALSVTVLTGLVGGALITLV